MSGLDIRKIGGRIGAEVVGVDIAAGLSDAVIADVNAALLEHKALVFRGQHLEEEGQLAFASRFGPLTQAHPTGIPSVDGQPQVLPIDGDDHRANHWHTDCTFVRTPPKASTLRALVMPSYGGNTLIANQAAAYRDLPAELRDFADTLWAVHSNDAGQPKLDTERADEYRKIFLSKIYQTAHPVVRVHPESGERSLFIGSFAQSIVGLSLSESRAILDMLQKYVTRPENVIRVQWTPGDLVLFDNRNTQHYGPDDYDDQPRMLHRVTIAGDAPVGVNGKQSYLIQGDDASHYTPAVA
ncbi:TauD/TfdA dioxygenase family protein [Lentzea nigeriaca]|uniref:TauD/TfdA dioxygenase family protein n=1 Tax=Lentzea nigeriaca TaxID=1128665 RepID=UPI00195D5782|nr:TauD/TfdA family dioxygenase [Lentzea nigeriaca]MBM7856385.1 taurine dioxygenase [Lentzea nigeriaca]